VFLAVVASSAGACEPPAPPTKPAKAVVSKLIKKLTDKDPETRANAAEGLGDLGSDAVDAVPALIKSLRDDDEKVVINASIALSQIGPPAVPFLITELGAEDKEIRRRCVWVLERIRPKPTGAVSALIAIMKEDKDAGLRVRAMEVLAGIDDKDSIGAFIYVITRDPDPSIRGSAIGLVSNFGPKAKAAIPALITVMKTDLNKPRLNQPAFGYEAASTLGFIGPDAVAPLVDLLEDSANSARLRTGAAWSLERVANYHGGKAIKPAVPALIKALKDEDKDLRSDAAAALAKTQKHGKDAVPALQGALQDELPIVRIKAADALCRIDASNAPAIRALIKEIQSNDENARFSASWYLRGLGEIAVPGLIKELRTGNVAGRMGAISGLKILGADAKDAIPALKEAIDDPDPVVREAAGKVLKPLQRK
jgi:HEAT repeat protein